ncbi:MAG: hypothetical protein J0L47_11210 [Flavobacteriales bacterium]|jgi:hypothetical protein|nr:hypothetical protein [Flavobacteriales bacterium]MCA0392355.1 hypothetical protein [Bacteroidota bacterium]
MAENELNKQQDYKLGKDKAHYLSGLEPTFIKKLMEIDSKDPILEGIRNGYADYIKEQNKDRLPDWLEPDRLKNAFNNRAPHPDRDKDRGNEPEK